jgi:23S rRNA (uridine2552-2'-O)-methyltransferase
MWNDHYTKKAKKEKYPARSVYKLKEIQDKYKIIKKGAKVLDLGCAPGSWLLFASKLIGNGGRIIGIDIQDFEIKQPENTLIFKDDIFSLNAETKKAFENGFDVILSDMAPSTTGNKNTDAARSYNLCMSAFFIVKEHLKSDGAFICKIFQGEDFNDFLNRIKKAFKWYKIFKPASCRKGSKEIYIIGTGYIN